MSLLSTNCDELETARLNLSINRSNNNLNQEIMKDFQEQVTLDTSKILLYKKYQSKINNIYQKIKSAKKLLEENKENIDPLKKHNNKFY